MKSIDKILESKRITITNRAEDGIMGYIHFGLWEGSVIATTGAGWDHVSVSPKKKNYTPTWDDMCRIKEIFWEDDEAVIQIHPPKSEYVNNLSNCLHLWRCNYKDMVLPPSVLVGIREGQTLEEAKREIAEAYEIAEGR